MATVTEHVAANVRRLRQARGLSLEDLSARLTVVGHPMGVTTLSKLETGKRGVDVEDLEALSRALATSVNTLMTDHAQAGVEQVRRALDDWRAAWEDRREALADYDEHLSELGRVVRDLAAEDPAVAEAARRHIARRGRFTKDSADEALGLLEEG